MRVMEAASIERAADYIRSVQRGDGSIPWFEGGITDPWDHVEAAMGLNVAADEDNARRALDWLKEQQNADGSWYATYDEHGVADASRIETNFTAWVATGVWHHWLAFHAEQRDYPELRRYWPMVRAAIDYVVDLQAPTGEIWWAVDARTGISHDALVTGCSAIAKSIECACAMGQSLGEPTERWTDAYRRLRRTLLEAPERFDRTWESKRRFSMDWFYPVLSGVMTGPEARSHLERHWSRFVEEQRGCRCVADRPWVTIAESSELVLALSAAGMDAEARELFSWLMPYRAEDGSFWTGFEYEQQVYWPDERPTWTTAAVLLAADALQGISGSRAIFTRPQAVL